MKETLGLIGLLAALSGSMAVENGPWMDTSGQIGCTAGVPPTIPGVQGPWGAPVTMAAPYSATPPNPMEARAMMAQSLPLQMVQPYGAGSPYAGGAMQAGYGAPGGYPPGMPPAGVMYPPGMSPPGAAMAPPGMPFGPGLPPGVHPPGSVPPAGAVAAVGALSGGVASRFATQRTSVRFISPAGMKVSWYAPGAPGKNGFASAELEVPGRYNFAQGAIYRLKMSEIPGRPNMPPLYPTLEVVPSSAKTNAFLAHSAVPVAFTEDDFEQVAAGNYVVKVIYLPDPQFQDLATTGTGEIVSTQLEPGADPIAEAYRRGSILLVVRLGNIDLESPMSPAMDAPSPYQPRMGMPPGMPGPGMPGPGPGPGPMVPYGAIGSGRPMVMGPNGPVMMMGPNGPMVVGPNGPMMPPGMPMGAPGQTRPPVVLPQSSGSQSPAGPPVVMPPSQGPSASAYPGGANVATANYPDAQAMAPSSVQQAGDASAAPPAAPRQSIFHRIFSGGQ